ncbi:Dual specificity phosphatase ibp1 [Rhodotorula toruloides]|nr:Dual specificity phosphatase ibp1 [Rhodotorula toruloides]
MPRTHSGDERVKYISPDEVAGLILAEPKRDDFLIIDVRSTDFPGGNLPGAVNITTREFRSDESLTRLIRTHILPRPSLHLLILHCMRSQTRGPYAAQLLSRSPSLPAHIDVRVMEGGFAGWWARFKGDERRERLFEGLVQREEGKGGWEEVVQAKEGESGEAEDSRKLRGELGR